MKSKVLGLLGLGAAVALTACGGGSKDAHSKAQELPQTALLRVQL